MCTISHQKCVCFVFLVVLAVLSCSGFRMDNLAMTDVSKRNSGALELFAGGAHRLRHRRQPPAAGTRRRFQCPEVDASWKAYKAGVVAVASVESSRCKENCTVQFKIHEWLKKPQTDDLIRLNFRTNQNGPCENENPENNMTYFLVKSKKEPNKKYILFLKVNGRHSYETAYAPELYKKKIKAVLRATSKFTPRPLRMDIKGNRKKRGYRLTCIVKGFPIPVITWKKRNSLLPLNSTRIGITQKNDGKERKRSTLMIRNLNKEDWGEYVCLASSVDGGTKNVSYTIGPSTGVNKNVSYTIRPSRGGTKNVSNTIRPSTDIGVLSKTDCELEFSGYCQNGGTCFSLPDIKEISCECPKHYEGRNCEIKRPTSSSMYRQTPLSTCKVGLFTKYNNC